jgi:hypothetical protein
MARLSARARKALPDSAFAGGIDKRVGKGSAKRRRFPVHDKAHATAALRLLGRAKGLSAGQKAAIRSRALKKLGRK